MKMRIQYGPIYSVCKITTQAVLIFLISGCAAIDHIGEGVRPKDDVKFVIVEQGNPIQNLQRDDGQPMLVTGQELKSGNVAHGVNITGWMAMPPSHWRNIVKKLGGTDLSTTSEAAPTIHAVDQSALPVQIHVTDPTPDRKQIP